MLWLKQLIGGQVALVRSLLNHGANDFNRAMAMAAGEGYANRVRLLLRPCK